ncbi:hypothetical protein ACKE5C_18980 (plasmid) [Aneurinibacillus thermoaerophilus]|uniref:Transposase n=1 Tax=Aneurinibacillus thermoaerophilus TaxID=143495 RepID=A0ABX8YFY1_ANETH|nr:hypothetical protein [Aneurinibacillus thermoaerophilus]QYY44718.1 hypothetical protein K3F53_18920 [Aneurinibacillus thermoaerophilus]
MPKPMYQLPLHPSEDQDIIERLNSMPRGYKANWVRQAIREKMARERGEQVYTSVAPIVQQEPPKPKKRGKLPEI